MILSGASAWPLVATIAAMTIACSRVSSLPRTPAFGPALAAMRAESAVLRKGGLADTLSLAAARAQDGDAEADRRCLASPDVAKILFSSGFTGEPKGILTTHEMRGANQQTLRQISPILRDEPPVLLDWLPREQSARPSTSTSPRGTWPTATAGAGWGVGYGWDVVGRGGWLQTFVVSPDRSGR
jgi:acyl-CoA synthetase (AMP-forming)/AMP-acid ligase II